jgi:hypothetical protein
MRVDEFVASRIVEAVVHGIDLTQALGRDPIATPDGIAATAAILDDLLARRTIPGRPPELSDDMNWILAASGTGRVQRRQAPADRLRTQPACQSAAAWTTERDGTCSAHTGCDVMTAVVLLPVGDGDRDLGAAELVGGLKDLAAGCATARAGGSHCQAAATRRGGSGVLVAVSTRADGSVS